MDGETSDNGETTDGTDKLRGFDVYYSTPTQGSTTYEGVYDDIGPGSPPLS